MNDPTNPRAFPSAAIDDRFGGMGLWDWYAAHALSGLLASGIYSNSGAGFEDFIAIQAGNFADFVLAERAKRLPEPIGAAT